MTSKKRLEIAIKALNNIAAEHLPKADTKRFWIDKTMRDCVLVLAEDVNAARLALKEIED